MLAKTKTDTFGLVGHSGIETLVTSGNTYGLGGTYTVVLSAPDIANVSGIVVASGGAMGQAIESSGAAMGQSLTTSIANHSGIFGSLGHATTVSSSGGKMGQAVLTAVSGYAQGSGGAMGQAVLSLASGYAQGSGGAMGQALTTSIATKQATLSASNRLNSAYIAGGNVSNTEFDYLNGVTSAIQTQLNNVSGYAQGSGAVLGQALTTSIANVSGYAQFSGGAMGQAVLSSASGYAQFSGGKMGQAVLSLASGYAQFSGGKMGQAVLSLASGYAQFSGGKMGQAVLSLASGYAQGSGGAMGQALTTSIATKQATLSASNRLNAAYIGGGNVSTTEFDYLNGVTSAIQTQLNNVSGYAQGSGAVMGQALTTSIANHSGIFGSLGHGTTVSASGGAMGQAIDSYLKSEIIIVSGLAVSASGGGSVDIDGLSALGGVGVHQTQDHFIFSDNGTEKKITFSNLQDAIFADISGDGAVAAGGALTIADDKIGSAELVDACSAVTSFTAPLIKGYNVYTNTFD